MIVNSLSSKQVEDVNKLNGVKSNVQDQLDNHTHNYAGSSSAGGAANNALAVNGLKFTVGTEDLTEGSSELATNTIYIFYEEEVS